MTNRISIPSPCSADWSKMTPAGQGRFCSLCSLTVVDFTQMSDTEIKEYFQCTYGQKTCGRFAQSQLAKPTVTGLKKFWEDQLYKVETSVRSSFFKTCLVACIIGAAFLTGCKNVTNYSHPKGKVSNYQLMGEPVLMGDTIYVEPDTTK